MTYIKCCTLHSSCLKFKCHLSPVRSHIKCPIALKCYFCEKIKNKNQVTLPPMMPFSLGLILRISLGDFHSLLTYRMVSDISPVVLFPWVPWAWSRQMAMIHSLTCIRSLLVTIHPPLGHHTFCLQHIHNHINMQHILTQWVLPSESWDIKLP